MKITVHTSVLNLKPHRQSGQIVQANTHLFIKTAERDLHKKRRRIKQVKSTPGHPFHQSTLKANKQTVNNQQQKQQTIKKQLQKPQ